MLLNSAFISLFLSTPSARRATLEWHLAYYSSLISIHALREEGDSIRPHGQRVDAISIHALREEGDLEGVARDVRANISIHALREEGDFQVSWTITKKGDFYPRPPRGGRRICTVLSLILV